MPVVAKPKLIIDAAKTTSAAISIHHAHQMLMESDPDEFPKARALLDLLSSALIDLKEAGVEMAELKGGV